MIPVLMATSQVQRSSKGTQTDNELNRRIRRAQLGRCTLHTMIGKLHTTSQYTHICHTHCVWRIDASQEVYMHTMSTSHRMRDCLGCITNGSTLLSCFRSTARRCSSSSAILSFLIMSEAAVTWARGMQERVTPGLRWKYHTLLPDKSTRCVHE